MLDRFAALPASFFTSDERLSWRAYSFLILLCFAIFTPGLTTIPPTDHDESLFAQASKQMIESGDYLHIHFQKYDRYKKPIGIYWIQAASVQLLNPEHLNEIWAYRIPSTIGATIAVVMTAMIGALLFSPMIGILAAIMMAGCLVLNVEARLAKTDACLLASVMVAQYALARAYINQNRGPLGLRLIFAFWTALGLGILIKGPIIVLVIASTLLWLRLSEKQIHWFKTLRPLLGLPYACLLIAPWFIAIIVSTHGQFVAQSAQQDLLAKLWQGQGRGIMPPGLHALIMPVVFFPFSLLLMLAFPDNWKNRRDPGVRFCLGWVTPAWIVFEISLTKLPHYTLPLYPALSLLAVKALGDGYPALAERKWKWLPPLAISVWLVVGMFFATSIALLPNILNHVWNSGAIAAALLLLIAQGAMLFLLMQRKESSILVMAAGSLIFFIVAFAGVLPSLNSLWLSREILQTAESIKPCPGPLHLTSSFVEPSLVFLAGTDTRIAQSPEGAEIDMRADPCSVGVVDDSSSYIFFDKFKPYPAQPEFITKLRGLTVSRGGWRSVSFYLMPSETRTK